MSQIYVTNVTNIFKVLRRLLTFKSYFVGHPVFKQSTIVQMGFLELNNQTATKLNIVQFKPAFVTPKDFI